eukprot:5328590-Heterocapsa_arctica.AAC.1
MHAEHALNIVSVDGVSIPVVDPVGLRGSAVRFGVHACRAMHGSSFAEEATRLRFPQRSLGDYSRSDL